MKSAIVELLWYKGWDLFLKVNTGLRTRLVLCSKSSHSQVVFKPQTLHSACKINYPLIKMLNMLKWYSSRSYFILHNRTNWWSSYCIKLFITLTKMFNFSGYYFKTFIFIFWIEEGKKTTNIGKCGVSKWYVPRGAQDPNPALPRKIIYFGNRRGLTFEPRGGN